MTRPTMSASEAEASGFTIDNHAHIGYKGPRFAPIEWVNVFTEREEVLIKALQRMIKMHNLMMKKTNHGASFYDAKCISEMNEAPLQAKKALLDVGVKS